MEEKILTRKEVRELGLDKVSVITTDMLEGYTSIESRAFFGCSKLTSITISNSIKSIKCRAFESCSSITSVTIGNGVESIGDYAFQYCISLTSIMISNSIKSIGKRAFFGCTDLTSMTIGEKTYEKQTITKHKCKAYKGFNANMTCRDFQYKEGETYEFEGNPELCDYGFHACLNLTDVFNYYCGKLEKDILVYEVELKGVSDEHVVYDSKIVAKKITVRERIL